MQRDEPEGGGPWRLQKDELEGTRESFYNNAKTGGETKLLPGNYTISFHLQTDDSCEPQR